MSAERFIDGFRQAFATGDPRHLGAVLAPGALLWHNDDGLEVEAAGALGGIAGLARMVDGLHVEVVEGTDRFVRFTVRGTVCATGQKLAARNCVFFELDEDGLVRRMDEYVDPTFTTQLGLL